MIKYVLYAVCTCSTLLTFWILFQYRGIKEHLISVIASHYNDFNTQVGHQQCFVRLKLFLHSILDFLSKSNKNWYKWMFLLLTMLLVARAGMTADSSLYFLLMSISSHLLHKLIVSNLNQTIYLFKPLPVGGRGMSIQSTDLDGGKLIERSNGFVYANNTRSM